MSFGLLDWIKECGDPNISLVCKSWRVTLPECEMHERETENYMPATAVLYPYTHIRSQTGGGGVLSYVRYSTLLHPCK